MTILAFLTHFPLESCKTSLFPRFSTGTKMVNSVRKKILFEEEVMAHPILAFGLWF